MTSRIVHGLDPRRAMPSGIDQMVARPDSAESEPRGMGYYADLGLGGIVCNVAFQDYMRSDEHWKTLVAGVEACHELGLIVWLYDEDGYPSGAAGGLVLGDNPKFEAQELAYDPSSDDPFILRPAYEYTHASNNYYAARRYANLIDGRAARSFIAHTHDAYCQYVGRLNAVLKPASFDRQVLLYYPIHDLWEEYLPVAEPLHAASQSPRAQDLIGSFMRLGQTLQRSQIPFALIDHQQLAAAEVGMDGKLSIGDQQFETIVVPRGAQLPAPAAAVVDTWRARGGRAVVDQADIPLDRESRIRDLPRTQRLVPESDRITLGQFRRDGRRVLLAVNVGREPYEGSLVVSGGGTWQVLDPADGSMRATGTDGANGVPLVLDRYQAVLLVENPRGSVP